MSAKLPPLLDHSSHSSQFRSMSTSTATGIRSWSSSTASAAAAAAAASAAISTFLKAGNQQQESKPQFSNYSCSSSNSRPSLSSHPAASECQACGCHLTEADKAFGQLTSGAVQDADPAVAAARRWNGFDSKLSVDAAVHLSSVRSRVFASSSGSSSSDCRRRGRSNYTTGTGSSSTPGTVSQLANRMRRMNGNGPGTSVATSGAHQSNNSVTTVDNNNNNNNNNNVTMTSLLYYSPAPSSRLTIGRIRRPMSWSMPGIQSVRGSRTTTKSLPMTSAYREESSSSRSPVEFVTQFKSPSPVEVRVAFVRHGSYPKERYVMPTDHDFRGYPPIESLGLPEFATDYERDPFNIMFLNRHRQTIFLKSAGNY